MQCKGCTNTQRLGSRANSIHFICPHLEELAATEGFQVRKIGPIALEEPQVGPPGLHSPHYALPPSKYGWLTALVEQHHWPVGKRDGEVILYYFDSLFLSFDEGMVAPCSPHPCFAVWGTTQAPCDLPFLSFSKAFPITIPLNVTPLNKIWKRKVARQWT